MQSEQAFAVLVTIEPPHMILAMEGDASGLLGFNWELVYGHSFQKFCGPATNLNAAIKSAALGHIAVVPSNLLCASGSCIGVLATCLPYYDAQDILVACRVSFQSNTAGSEFFHSNPELNAFSHHLAQGQNMVDQRGRPVRRDVVTHEMLEQVWHLTVQQAADKLCMSLTTLKTACRRLGIARWPRNGGRAPLNAALSPPPAVGVSLAYTRRLYRKYVTSETRRACRAGQASSAETTDCAATCSTPSSTTSSFAADIVNTTEFGCWGPEGCGSLWASGSPASPAPSDPAWELALEAAAPLSAEAWAAVLDGGGGAWGPA
jgi:hypothetical protein